MPARTGSSISTIKGRILVAFLVMTLVTGALGFYAALGIREEGGFRRQDF